VMYDVSLAFLSSESAAKDRFGKDCVRIYVCDQTNGKLGKWLLQLLIQKQN
jgi:hypothetical protein